jgi:hypothetical protein
MERHEQKRARRMRGNRLKKMKNGSTGEPSGNETDIVFRSTERVVKPRKGDKKGSIADRTGSWLRQKDLSLFFLGEAKQELTNGKK